MLARCPRLAHWNDGPSLSPALAPFLFPNEKPGFWPGESKTFDETRTSSGFGQILATT
jgi:hypothetical protein